MPARPTDPPDPAMAARLREARAARGYASAPAFARAIGFEIPTYHHYENGRRGFARHASRIAKFLRVDLEWLISGRGRMDARPAGVPLHGTVGAGAHIIPFTDDGSAAPFQFVSMPDPDHLGALRVSGDSQYPRYLDGEIVLVETIARPPSQLIGQYCVCDLEDGRRMLKLLRRGSEPGLFTLESVNAPPIENVKLITAFAVIGSLTN